MTKEDQTMIDNHWEYVANVIASVPEDKDMRYPLSTIEFHYKSAFEHGLRHGRELNTREYK